MIPIAYCTTCSSLPELTDLLPQPTLNPDSSMLTKDWVLLNRYAALAAQQGYKDSFRPGDVVALK